jgi:hypothetical protein
MQFLVNGPLGSVSTIGSRSRRWPESVSAPQAFAMKGRRFLGAVRAVTRWALEASATERRLVGACPTLGALRTLRQAG